MPSMAMSVRFVFDSEDYAMNFCMGLTEKQWYFEVEREGAKTIVEIGLGGKPTALAAIAPDIEYAYSTAGGIATV